MTNSAPMTSSHSDDPKPLDAGAAVSDELPAIEFPLESAGKPTCAAGVLAVALSRAAM
jgi:hypothetical protein